jgi:hypothetical protein
MPRLILWKDILQSKLHIVDLARRPESLRTIDMGMAIGVTADVEGRDDIILAEAKDGVTKFDLETGKHEHITKLWPESEGPEQVRRSVRETTYLSGSTDAPQIG